MYAYQGKSLLAWLGIWAVICCLFWPGPVYAKGDGSGGVTEDPLTLVSSLPADGPNDVAVDAVIKLACNKNVIDLTGRDFNRQYYTLASTGAENSPAAEGRGGVIDDSNLTTNTTADSQVPVLFGQQEEAPQVTDTDKQNSYATLAGFVLASIPVYLIWRKRQKNQ